MGAYDYLEKLKDEEEVLFKRCVRKLLDATFIVEERDEKLYAFLASETNCFNIRAYLRLMGYDIEISEKLKYAMLIQNEDDIETVGIKKSNLLRFEPKQIHVLLALWLLYLKKVGFYEEVYVTCGDIIDETKQYGIEVQPGEFWNALRLFKRYSLLSFNDNEKEETAKIRLYPTLCFAMDIKQLELVMREYLPDSGSQTNEEDLQLIEYYDDEDDND